MTDTRHMRPSQAHRASNSFHRDELKVATTLCEWALRMPAARVLVRSAGFCSFCAKMQASLRLVEGRVVSGQVNETDS